MPQYDPQRSRSRQRKADDVGPAPVDALLGPEPAAPESVTAETKTPAASVNGRAPRAVSPADSPAIDSPPVRLAGDEPTGSRSGAKPLAVAAAVAAVLLAVWWVLRRRRGPDGDATG